MNTTSSRLDKCEEKIKYLIEEIIPMLKKRNDWCNEIECLLVSFHAKLDKMDDN